MKLYELKQDTLRILESLRNTGTGGEYDSQRSVGKTTALLIRAKQLVDADDGPVIYVANGVLASMAKDRYRFLFPTGWEPIFTGRIPDLIGRKGTSLLVDEPYILNLGTGEWRTIFSHPNISRVESVGSWHPLGR